MKKPYISDAVIRRLPRYYRYLDYLESKGHTRISSVLLGKKMDLTASQIRQDINCFGNFGQQGYGYNISELKTEISHILGADNLRRLIVIGAGNLGHALLQSFDFAQCGFEVGCIFDVSPSLIGTSICDIPVRSTEDLDAYCAEFHPEVAVLTVPQCVSRATARRIVSLGVNGIWNFTNMELGVENDVCVENVHFADSLLTLSYQISQKQDAEQ